MRRRKRHAKFLRSFQNPKSVLVAALPAVEELQHGPWHIRRAARVAEPHCEFPLKVSPHFLEDVIIQMRLGASLTACFPALTCR